MTNEADFENMARQQKTIEALRAENESMQGSLDSLRNFLGDMTIKLPVGRAIQLIKDQRAELDRLREDNDRLVHDGVMALSQEEMARLFGPDQIAELVKIGRLTVAFTLREHDLREEIRELEQERLDANGLVNEYHENVKALRGALQSAINELDEHGIGAPDDVRKLAGKEPDADDTN